MKTPVWVLICNPENRRQKYFTDALGSHLLVSPIIVSYQSLLNAALASEVSELIMRSLSAVKNARLYIKIESPGENFEVEKSLIKLGCLDIPERLTLPEADELSYEKGRFLYLKEWFWGYKYLLASIEKALNEFSKKQGCQLSYLNTPEAIVQMMDKYSCQRLLQKSSIEVPQLIPSGHCFNDLIENLLSKKIYQVFIKSRYGSSAAGVVALRLKPDGKQLVARTTLAINKKQPQYLYNSLKVKIYQAREEIEGLYNAIMAEDGYVERWIPKPLLKGEYIDFRIVVIEGKAMHTITRCSRSPMSNLHLGNHRGDIYQLPYGKKMIDSVCQAAESVSMTLSDASCIGVDALCTVKGKARVLEVNAFGDLLPGVLFENLTTYEKQIQISINNKRIAKAI